MKKMSIKLIIGLFMLFTGIILVITGFSIGGPLHILDIDEETESFVKEMDGEITSVDIKFDAGEFEIQTGDKLKIEATNIVSENLTCEIEDNVLKIKLDNKYKWFNINNDGNWSIGKIVVYIPESFNLKNINLESGFGNLVVDDLKADKIIVDFGVGESTFNNISVDTLKLDFEVGDVDFNNSNVKVCDIHQGVGDIDMNIKGNLDDYNISADKGLGDIKINGEKVKSYKGSNTSDEYKLNINGGIGDININIE